MFHFEGGVWVDVTYSLDTVNNVITGRVNSLSGIGVGGSGSPVTGFNHIWLLIIAVFIILSGFWARTKVR